MHHPQAPPSTARPFFTLSIIAKPAGPTLHMDPLPNQCLEANPDIGGPGIRISFYLQTMALVLLAGRSLENALIDVWILMGTNFGLTVSALLTAVRNKLSLYDAIIVTDLLWLANYAIFLSLVTYNRRAARSAHMVQYAAIVQTYISMACIIYLWARAPSFEFDSHAGKTVFVVLFVSTSATGEGRVVALVITTLLLIGCSSVTTAFLLRHRSFAREKPDPGRFYPSPPSASISLSRPPARPSPALILDPHMIPLSLFFGAPYLITLISTELQIARSDLCSGDSSFWGFGQILAVTVTITPVVITVAAFHKYGRQRLRTPRGATISADVRWFGRFNIFTAAYVFIVAPPFIHDQKAIWDHDRLENRLNTLQGWVWSANIALSTASAALLALTSVASSSVAQSLLILSGIFSLFGFLYAIFLAFHIGDRKAQFPFARANSMDRGRFWNPSIMMSLPLTWMSWSVVSFLCFLLALGVQNFTFDLRIMSGDFSSSATISNQAVNATDTADGRSASPNAVAVSLNIFQLAIFTAAIVWSFSYLVMIHLEMRKCRDTRYPVRSGTYQLAVGSLQETHD
ncbi:hypothetical protein C8R44DRAFT_772104 [Mycena epipterygia]|nr:hypothetical protein C8R44DRAFT_772104 [Mycena epipterygia]